MKYLFFLFTVLPTLLFAQEPVVADSAAVELGDTTIYKFADEAARFPTPCERYDTTAMAKNQCSDIAVLAYVNKRAGYPVLAREQGLSGTAVVAFVIEKNGVISRAEILKDPGGGIGMSALRAVAEMAGEVRWRAGRQG